MSNNKENEDIFLQSIGKVKPIKKSNKKFKELNLSIIKKIRASKQLGELQKPLSKIKLEKMINKKDLKIESPPIGRMIKRGRMPINKKVDFPGLSLENAKVKFFTTIEECFDSNKRCILFVTGNGIKKTNYNTTNIISDNNPKIKLFHGKIREDFHKWIYEQDVVSKILNVVPAGPSHGGDGAFFVYLRKNRN